MLLDLLALASTGFKLVSYQEDVLRRVRFVPRAEVANTGDAVIVLIDGHPVGGAPEGAQVRSVPCYRPGGVAFNVTGVVSGAYTVTTDFGVVAWSGYRKGFSRAVVHGVAKDGSVLLMSDDQAPAQEAIEADHAWIDQAERRTEIGPADEVWMLPNGWVLGRAYRDPKGGYSNRENLPEGAMPETFLWHGGRHVPLRGFWPMAVSAQGVALGLGKGARSLREPEDYWTGPLVLWKEGRIKSIDLKGNQACFPAFARSDGSFVFGVAFGANDHRLAILGKRGLEILPPTIDGKPVDLRDVEVDERGRIHLDDRQIVRR